MPVGSELLLVDAEHVFDETHGIAAAGTAPLCTRSARAVQDVCNCRVTPASSDVRPEGVTEPVGKVSRVVQIVDVRQFFTHGGIAQPDRCVRVNRADGQVLSHAFDKPKRKVEVASENVVLKRVHELVANHVIGVGEAGADGQHDAALHRLGDSARPFAQDAFHDVGLLEMGMSGVEDERLASGQLMIEDACEARVPALGNTRGFAGGLCLLRVEMDVEVLRLEHLELERLILNFVLAEILRGRGPADGGKNQRSDGHCTY